jgi:hypothetical protein
MARAQASAIAARVAFFAKFQRAVEYVNARKAGESGAGSREESLCCGKQAVCGTVGRLTGIGGRLALRSGERRSKTET